MIRVRRILSTMVGHEVGSSRVSLYSVAPPIMKTRLTAGIVLSGSGADLFGEITGKGVQTGVGTIAGLGYGLPMSRLYTK